MSIDVVNSCSHEHFICNVNPRQVDIQFVQEKYVRERCQNMSITHPLVSGSNAAEDTLVTTTMKIKTQHDAMHLASWEARYPGTEENNKFICMIKSICGPQYVSVMKRCQERIRRTNAPLV